jgi:hypothetical protein
MVAGGTFVPPARNFRHAQNTNPRGACPELRRGILLLPLCAALGVHRAFAPRTITAVAATLADAVNRGDVVSPRKGGPAGGHAGLRFDARQTPQLLRSRLMN